MSGRDCDDFNLDLQQNIVPASVDHIQVRNMIDIDCEYSA